MKKYILFVIVAALALAVDQGTKLWAMNVLRDGPNLSVIDGLLELHFTVNRGAAFSLFAESGAREPLLIGIAVLACLAILYMAYRLRPRERLLATALGLVFAGALGNLIDRVRFSWVVDFILIHDHGRPRWPVFNAADVFIFAGAGLLILHSLRTLWKARRSRPTDPSPPSTVQKTSRPEAR